MRNVGIKAKLVCGAACIVIGLGGAATVHSVLQLRQLLRQEMMERVEAQALNWIEANYAAVFTTGDRITLDRALDELRKKSGIAYVSLAGTDGRLRAAVGLPEGLPPPGIAQNGPPARQWSQLEDADNLRYFDLIMRIPATGTEMSGDLGAMFSVATDGARAAGSSSLGLLRVGVDRKQIDNKLYVLVLRNVALAGLLVLLAVMASWILAKRIVDPITEMGEAAEKISAGDLSQRVMRGIGLRDELGELVRNFNAMAERLKQNRAEMDLLYAGLEEKVRERTLELEKANRKLEELDRRKSESLSTASHELRTPLTSIKAHAELLLDAVNPSPGEVHESLEIINESADRLTRLISDILDLRRIEDGVESWRMGEADLRAVVLEAGRLLNPHADERGVELQLADVPHQRIWMDSDHIQRVVTNLMGNAIKFSPSGATVRVGFGRSALSGPRRAEPGEFVRVWVADDGPGIPPEEHESIFLPFYRAERAQAGVPGAGLGLAISRGIVFHHQGEIWVESAVGAGSTFYFTIPLTNPQEATRRKAAGALG